MTAKKNTEEPVEGEVVGERTKKTNEQIKDEYFEKHIHHYHRGRGGIFWGLIFILIGGMFLAQSYFGLNLWENFWPIVLVIFGVALILRSF